MMKKYTSQKLAKVLGLIALGGLSSLSFAQTFNWSQAGPVYNAGRSRNMVVDLQDNSGNTLYTGSASSGIFKSTDGGSTWAVVNNTTTIRNISYMAQATNGRIYAATGEGFLSDGQKAKAEVGTGVYELVGAQLNLLSDGGAAKVGTVINRMACDPSNPDRIALATNLGIFITTNSGVNFDLISGIPTSSNSVGMDVKFTSAGELYCTVGGERQTHASSRVYKSNSSNVNSGTSFTDITPSSSVLTNTVFGRIELAIAPSNNNVIYASIANKPVPGATPYHFKAHLKALFVSYDAGNTWGLILQGSPQLDPLTNGANIATGDYAHYIGVNPGNPNQLFMGGYLFYLFTRTGGTDTNPVGFWLNVGTPAVPNIPYYLHENIHDIKVVGSGTSAKFYFITDAGIYRSLDLASGGVTNSASFQPFYKGLVTGQFNSVSIEAYPALTDVTNVGGEDKVNSNDGFIGGTGGNGFTYFSGNYTGNNNFPTIAQESNYLSGEFYNVEYSKILPNAAFASAGKDRDGDMYRASDVRSAPPTILSMNSYTGVLSQITPAPSTFLNNVNTTSGSIFKLWENYGQIKNTPDSIVFYNDSIKVQSSIQTVATLISQSNFTFSIGRPNPAALIDSIAIRTGTVIYENAAGTKLTVPFTASDKKDLFIKLPNNYTTPTATTVPPIGSMTGPIAAAGVTLNSTSNLDEISVTFTAPPFANKTATAHAGVQDPAGFYKVYATIFYKYKVNDSITLVDNSISTRPQTYELVLTKPLRWSYINPNGPKPIAAPTNQPVKMATRLSARLAIGYSGGGTAGQTAIIVSKSPLNLNDPLSFVRVSGTGALTQDANGASTTSVISITAKPSVIEWSKSGTELYFATEDNKLYRVSNLYTIMDNTPSNYSGKLSTDIFRYNSASPTNPFNSTVINPNSPYRTTLLGSFTTKTITSISISKNDSSMALTFNDPAGTIVMYSGNNIRTSDHTNINFTSRNGTGLSNVTAYCSLMEKDNSKEVFIGTNKGIYYTSDITATTPSWSNINNQLPTIQVFDLEQQTLPPWSCYNSGQIYAATYGRGVWTNKNYFSPTIVSVKEQEKPKVENNLSVYPNPTNGSVFVSFNSVNGESVNIQIMDINGRVVKSEPIGKLYPGQLTYSMETSDLSAGIYMVNVISDSNVKRVAKLVVTK